MTIPHWEDDEQAWDTLQLGPWVMPGVWTVDFSVRREMDVKKAVSTDGARLKDKGYMPPQLTFIGKLIAREHWSKLQEIMPKIHPRRKGASRDPYRVVHPKTLLMGIENIFVHEIDAVSLDKGVLTIELRAYEWTKAPKPVSKGKDVPEFTMQGVKFVGPLEPPRALARYPGMRGIVVDESNPDDALVSFPGDAPPV